MAEPLSAVGLDRVRKTCKTYKWMFYAFAGVGLVCLAALTSLDMFSIWSPSRLETWWNRYYHGPNLWIVWLMLGHIMGMLERVFTSQKKVLGDIEDIV